MNTFFKKIQTFAVTHKKTSIAIAIAILIIIYSIYKSLSAPTGEPTYVLGTVEQGTVVSSITGSGQVSSGRMLELKPEASGKVIYVAAHSGQKIYQGQLIVELDPENAQKSVRDAEANLASAKLSMQKVQAPTDTLSLLQAENSLTQSKNDLAKAYEDAYNTVSSTFIDLPTAMTGVDSILHGTDVDPSGTASWNVSYYGDAAAQFETEAHSGKARQYAKDADQKYRAAKIAYDKNFADFKNTPRTANTEAVQAILKETYETSGVVSDAIQSTQNLIQYYQDTLTGAQRTPATKSNSQLTSLSNYTSKINGDVTSLLSIKNTIASDLVTIPEKQASLDKLKQGADTLDVQSSQLSVTKAENALADAKETLDNYFVRAPFAGTLAKLSVDRGDTASSSTTVATLIADDQVVDIPLNEVDIAKVKLGDKTTLTFDAIDELTLTGKVVAMDSVGTVTQGVVNYTVTIAFDSTDARVKPGMSTTASIITKVAADVLVVPSSAVKTGSEGSYVLVMPENQTTPQQVTVMTGISDDTKTEILSGIKLGEKIVTRTLAATTSSTPAAPSLLGGGAGTQRSAGGGNALRGVAR